VWSATEVAGDPDESGITPGEREKRIMPCAIKLFERNGVLDVGSAVSLLWELECFAENHKVLPFDVTSSLYMTATALEVARSMARESTGGSPRSTNEWVTWLRGFVSSNGYTILEAMGMVKPFACGVTIISTESVTQSLGMHVSAIRRHLSGVRDAEWRKSGATGQVTMAVLHTLPDRLQQMICNVLKITGARSVPVGLNYVTMKATILDALGRVIEETSTDWEARSAFVQELVEMRSAAAAVAAAADAAGTEYMPSDGGQGRGGGGRGRGAARGGARGGRGGGGGR